MISRTGAQPPLMLVDANLLIYAADSTNPFPRPAAHWLESVLLVVDARLAALAIEHGLRVYSCAATEGSAASHSTGSTSA